MNEIRAGASYLRPAVVSCVIRKGFRRRGAGYHSNPHSFPYENCSVSLSIGLCKPDLVPVPWLRQPNGCQHLLQSSPSGTKPRLCLLYIENRTAADTAMSTGPNFGGYIEVLSFPEDPAVNGGSQHRRRLFSRNMK